MLGEHEVFITASMGITLGVFGKDRPEDLLRQANIAMYQAKNKGKAHRKVFDPRMNAPAQDRSKPPRLRYHARRPPRRGLALVIGAPEGTRASFSRTAYLGPRLIGPVFWSSDTDGPMTNSGWSADKSGRVRGTAPLAGVAVLRNARVEGPRFRGRAACRTPA